MNKSYDAGWSISPFLKKGEKKHPLHQKGYSALLFREISCNPPFKT